MIVLCILAIVFIAVVLYFVFAIKCIQYGIYNKYHDDEQIIMEGSQLPPIPGEEEFEKDRQ